MRLVSAAIVCIGLLAGPASVVGSGHPFDGQREGPVFGVSVGPGTSWVSYHNGSLSGEKTLGTATFCYRMGWAPSNQYHIHALWVSSSYAYKVWEHFESMVDHSETNLTYITGVVILPLIAMFSDQHFMFGLGSTYYFRTKAPSWFVELGGGGSMTSDPDEDDSPSAFPGSNKAGPGLFAGFGYEFASSVNVELSATWGQAKWDAVGGEKKWTSFSAMLMLGVLAY